MANGWIIFVRVPNVPDDVYQMITRRALQARRTISAEVLHIVEQHLQQQESRQALHQSAVLSLRNRLAEKPQFSLDLSDAIREGRAE